MKTALEKIGSTLKYFQNLNFAMIANDAVKLINKNTQFIPMIIVFINDIVGVTSLNLI